MVASIQKSSHVLDYGLQRKSYMKGVHHNVKALITLIRKAGIKYDNTFSRVDYEQKIADTYKTEK